MFRPALLVVLIGCVSVALWEMVRHRPHAVAQEPPTTAPSKNAELAELFAEDQRDRKEFPKTASNPEGVEALLARDARRLERVKEIYLAGELRAAADYYHAAMILQHGREPNEYLLAHELAIVALGLGDKRGWWLSAAAEDRFLNSIGRPQRFGTQFRKANEGAAYRLGEVDENVTDDLRRRFHVPPLDQARAREKTLNEPVPTPE